MEFVASNLDLILLFALMGALPGAIIRGLIAKQRGAVIGAVGGAAIGPVLWLGGMLLFWPGV